VLAVPLATAAYPRLSAAAEQGDEDGYRTALASTARTVVLLAGLGAAALASLAVPAAVLMQAEPAWPGIVGFAPGLFGYALFALLSRALYARGATRAAAFATAAGWLVAAVAALAFAGLGEDRQVLGLGLANSIGMTVLAVLLVLAVRRHAGPGALAGLTRATVTAVLAAGCAAAAGWGLVAALEAAMWPTPGVAARLTEGMLGGVAVVVVFGAVAFVLDRRDLKPLVAVLRRRSGR
jgi:putative peptidoglycan lipid II flippase